MHMDGIFGFEQKLDPRLEEFRECFESAGLLGYLLDHQEWAISEVERLRRKRGLNGMGCRVPRKAIR